MTSPGCEATHQTPSGECPVPAEIDRLWDARADLTDTDEAVTRLVHDAVDLLDQGVARVAWVDAETDEVALCERSRRAIGLSFVTLPMQTVEAPDRHVQDRLPAKRRFDGVRAVAGSVVRWGSYVAPGCVLLPSFVNIGARVGSGTMVDTWATVGTCAQIGSRVHLAGGVGIGGVMEPPGARPVVIEDEAFIGSRCVVVEGARVRTGAKLGAGAILTGSTPVIDAETGDRLPSGELPAWSVSVASTRMKEFPGGSFGQPCILVIRRLAPGESHDKLRIDDLLRSHGGVLT